MLASVQEDNLVNVPEAVANIVPSGSDDRSGMNTNEQNQQNITGGPVNDDTAEKGAASTEGSDSKSADADKVDDDIEMGGQDDEPVSAPSDNIGSASASNENETSANTLQPASQPALIQAGNLESQQPWKPADVRPRFNNDDDDDNAEIPGLPAESLPSASNHQNNVTSQQSSQPTAARLTDDRDDNVDMVDLPAESLPYASNNQENLTSQQASQPTVTPLTDDRTDNVDMTDVPPENSDQDIDMDTSPDPAPAPVPQQQQQSTPTKSRPSNLDLPPRSPNLADRFNFNAPRNSSSPAFASKFGNAPLPSSRPTRGSGPLSAANRILLGSKSNVVTPLTELSFNNKFPQSRSGDGSAITSQSASNSPTSPCFNFAASKAPDHLRSSSVGSAPPPPRSLFASSAKGKEPVGPSPIVSGPTPKVEHVYDPNKAIGYTNQPGGLSSPQQAPTPARPLFPPQRFATRAPQSTPASPTARAGTPTPTPTSSTITRPVGSSATTPTTPTTPDASRKEWENGQKRIWLQWFDEHIGLEDTVDETDSLKKIIETSKAMAEENSVTAALPAVLTAPPQPLPAVPRRIARPKRSSAPSTPALPATPTIDPILEDKRDWIAWYVQVTGDKKKWNEGDAVEDIIEDCKSVKKPSKTTLLMPSEKKRPWMQFYRKYIADEDEEDISKMSFAAVKRRVREFHKRDAYIGRFPLPEE
ncbi:hypothetical protein BDV95DRAFT_586233 [Massariosphaeria phaeospora]|uniref:Uncharacterized protein n=1 Tax=Massariosphaeria phaeospora TaxID=100035 RepID=A0A7C8M4R1_9PLEO|nr:hypothetical protein BDV95DRAFT_586233 [Massariosphaeria phaeospora]